MGERRGVVVLTPLLHELQVRIELEELRGGRALRGAQVPAAREDEQVPLGILGDADRFADGVARHDERQHFFGDLQARRVLFELRLLGEGRLHFRARTRTSLGDGRRAQQHDCDND